MQERGRSGRNKIKDYFLSKRCSLQTNGPNYNYAVKRGAHWRIVWRTRNYTVHMQSFLRKLITSHASRRDHNRFY